MNRLLSSVAEHRSVTSTVLRRGGTKHNESNVPGGIYGRPLDGLDLHRELPPDQLLWLSHHEVLPRRLQTLLVDHLRLRRCKILSVCRPSLVLLNLLAPRFLSLPLLRSGHRLQVLVPVLQVQPTPLNEPGV